MILKEFSSNTHTHGNNGAFLKSYSVSGKGHKYLRFLSLKGETTLAEEEH
jgi:hypothetical protein